MMRERRNNTILLDPFTLVKALMTTGIKKIIFSCATYSRYATVYGDKTLTIDHGHKTLTIVYGDKTLMTGYGDKTLMASYGYKKLTPAYGDKRLTTGYGDKALTFDG
ncbi:hypothetical protein AVEN_144979-1 [Araneus ventricosus]|uniref:Uncharacterized protein n=1 Tax=Araneus ventricosus TaxID=182803 RepID=A0A4Y2VZ60_ARAVE|nr:hypothetical protein AVEN_144979-1 [Araneus ventricosus]